MTLDMLSISQNLQFEVKPKKTLIVKLKSKLGIKTMLIGGVIIMKTIESRKSRLNINN